MTFPLMNHGSVHWLVSSPLFLEAANLGEPAMLPLKNAAVVEAAAGKGREVKVGKQQVLFIFAVIVLDF